MSSPQTEQEIPRQSHGETKSANAPYKCNYCWLLLYLVDWPVSLENQREVIFWENISVGSLTFDQGILWCFDPAHLCRWRDAILRLWAQPFLHLSTEPATSAVASSVLALACLCCLDNGQKTLCFPSQLMQMDQLKKEITTCRISRITKWFG